MSQPLHISFRSQKALIFFSFTAGEGGERNEEPFCSSETEIFVILLALVMTIYHLKKFFV